MIKLYYSYRRGGRRESTNTGVSHISLAQYSTAHIERLSLLRNGRGVLLRPFIAWRVLWGPCIPCPNTLHKSFTRHISNKHVLAQLGTVQKLALKDRTGKARSEKLFLENYPKPQSGPSEMNEMKGRRLQPFFSFKLLCRKKTANGVLHERMKTSLNIKCICASQVNFSC